MKTTGGKGLHVVAPLDRHHGFDEVRAFAHALALRMASEQPERYTEQAAKAERGGRIFLDYLRNGWSASAVAAYSTRSRPGAPVSTPITWAELEEGAQPGDFTVQTVPQRLGTRREAPWDGYTRPRQRLTRRMRAELELK